MSTVTPPSTNKIPVTPQRIALDVIEPLCDETKRMFNPIRINERDRLRIKMHKEGKQFHCEFFSIDDEMREYSASYNAAVRFTNIMPGRQMLSPRIWIFEATDLNALLLSYHWKPYQLIFQDAASRTLYNYLILNFVKQTQRVREREKLNGFSFQDSSVLPLADYQKKALKACINTEGFGLFMEQGTGKTPIAIARICNEAVQKEEKGEGIYRALIICPRTVRSNWKKEIERFSSIQGKVTLVKGSQIDRVKCLIDAMQAARDEYCKFSVAVISMDSVNNTEEALNMVPWDLCILDESHGIKNPKTNRWKAMKKLRDNCKSRMVLTGTPITNTLFDLWTQFEFMGEGWSGFTSFNKFKKFYGNFQNVSPQAQHGYQKLVGLINLPMIQERLARQAYLIKKSDALPDLPKKMYDIHEVEMTDEQEKCYRSLCETLMAEFEDMLSSVTGEKETLIVNNILTQMLRLAQVTSGFVGIPAQIDEDGNVISPAKINHFDPNPKVEAVVEILKGKSPEQKTIIWSNNVPNIKTLRARLAYENIKAVTYYGDTSEKERLQAVKAFNEDPETKVFIGNPRAGGTGLTLIGYPIGGKAETYCDHVIYFAQNWSAVDRSQSEDRPHRRGTVCHVQYTDMVVPDTIDEEIRNRVMDKRISALKIQDVKSVISRIMKG